MGFNPMQMIKQVPKYAKHLGTWAKANSNWLLAAFAALGVFLTTEEAIRATVKAVKVCEEKQIKDGKEIVQTVWKLYIPTIGFFLLTMVSIGGNAHINARRLTTAAGLIALKEADLKNFKEKAKEMLGERKVDKIEDEQAREFVEKNPPPVEDQIYKTGHGNDLFCDYLTGQYFRACPEYIGAIQEKMNRSMENDIDGVIMVSYYLNLLGVNRNCYIAEALWDLAEMREHGSQQIDLDVTSCQWMEVNGKQEMVCLIKPSPLPSGI